MTVMEKGKFVLDWKHQPLISVSISALALHPHAFRLNTWLVSI